MSTLMGQLQSRIEAAVNKTGTYNEALQNLADAFGAPASETGSRLIPVVKVFDPTIDNATAAQNYLLYNSTVVAGGLPAMAMDFTSGTLDSRVTFTRASTATRVNASGLIESVAINAPRFDYDPASRAPKGLLVEEQRTNLLTYSEDFSNAAWTKTRSSITENSAIAPDGILTADKIVEDTATGTHAASQSVTIAATTAYTLTCYAKKSERPAIVLQFPTTPFGATVLSYFDLDAGTVGASQNCTASISNAGNGWYRCSITATSTVGGAGTIAVYASLTNTNSYTGDGISGIFVWGAQLEAGSFATSYIPTVAAQVTRSADNASMTGTNFSSWYNQSEGTLFFNAAFIGRRASGFETVAIASAGAAVADCVGVGFEVSGNDLRGLVFVGGVATVNLKDGDPQLFVPASGALAYKVNDFAFSASGTAVITDTSGAVPTGVDRLTIGVEPNFSSSRFNGHIRRIMYYNTRLTNAQLQALTS